MSSAVDVNVFLYASDESSRFHAKARDLLDRLAKGPDLLYVFWPVIIGYLRMATHPAIFPGGVTTLWSHDRDFRKFDQVQVRDPFA